MITAPLARLVACALLLLMTPVIAGAAQLPLDKIKLPPGFEISIFADNVPNAREMALGDKGTVFVGSLRAGKVYAIRSRDGKAFETHVVASNLTMPVGVAFHQGALYVSAVDRIMRLDKIEDNLARPPLPQIVTDRLPSDTHHGWKFIAFGPDGMLYVPVGAPCNVCNPDSNRYANIMRMKADGSGLEIFARGVRNSVGFDWDPRTRELWFTDNGRDWLGDDKPDCELNFAPRKDMHFGFPFCHAGDISDPEFGQQRACSEFSPPAVKLGAHVAPLGMRFYTGSSFPAAYKNNIFIAEHGSWNRSRKSGYRVVRVITSPGAPPQQEVFAEGWLQDQSAWGRPADVLVMPDGALLISDDQAGVIYRVAYKQPR